MIDGRTPRDPRGPTDPRDIRDERRADDPRDPRDKPRPGDRRAECLTIKILAVSFICLVIFVIIGYVLIAVRANDLRNIQNQMKQEEQAHRQEDVETQQSFCAILTVSKTAPPIAPYGKALAAEAEKLARQFNCPGA